MGLIDLDKSFEYIGKFYLPKKENMKFSGILSYNSNDGLFLKIIEENYIILNDLTNIEEIFGFVEELGLVTLISCLERNGKMVWGSPSYSIKFFYINIGIVGLHCLKNDLSYSKISFHFKELNSFMVPFVENYKMCLKENNCFVDIENNFKLEILQGSRDGLDLSFILDNEYLKKIAPNYVKFNENSKNGKTNSKDLENKAKTEREKLFITKPFYFIHLSNSNQNIEHYMRFKFKIEKLFSLFFLMPVSSNFITLEKDKKQYSVIYSNNLKDKEKKELNFSLIPVNIYNIKDNLKNVIESWNNILKNELIDSLIFNKIYKNSTSAYQEFIILMSIIGAWQVDINKKDKDKNKYNYKERYGDFLSSTLEDTMIYNGVENIRGIKSIFTEILGDSKNFQEIGKKLSDIRDCIVHLDGKKNSTNKSKELDKYGDILENEWEMQNISEALFLSLIYSIYNKIGLELSDSQKKMFLRELKYYESI